jgi:DNA-binding Lrp family transcriptional regulator
LIDDVDFKILKYVCEGIYSYNELGKLCGIGRSTAYRRIDRLEKEGIIRRRIMAIPNFEKINFSAVIVGLNLNPKDLDKTVPFLKTQHQVKFIWLTYGTHDLILTILCDKGNVGECLHNLKRALQTLGVTPTKFDISVSITWEKMHLTP